MRQREQIIIIIAAGRVLVGAVGGTLDRRTRIRSVVREFRLELKSAGMGGLPDAIDGSYNVALWEALPWLRRRVEAMTLPKTLSGVLAFAGTVLGTAAGAGAQAVLYVDANAGSGGDGSSWISAFDDLHHALDVAGGIGVPVEIWVAQGTYAPDPAGLSDSRKATFRLLNNVGLYGGFDGTEVNRDERAPSAKVTILSGDIGVPGNSTDNCYHVLTASVIGTTAVLDGFTIAVANADGVFPDDRGGGLYLVNGDAVFSNCIFSGNHALVGAGAFVGGDSSPTLIDCAFVGNSASTGGGLGNEGSSPMLINCTFLDNSADSGAAVSNASASPVLVNCSFSRNAALSGGGMFTGGSSSRPMAINCVFLGNTAVSGGGLYNFSNSAPALTNCLFSGNSAGFAGGGMYNTGSTGATVVNCTFSQNTASGLTGGGGGIYISSVGSLAMDNCILWGNNNAVGTDEVAQIRVAGGAVPVINNCCIQGWTGALGGSGNMGDDPLFVDPDGDDNVAGTADDNARFSPGSPCIDAGGNGAVPADTSDLDGDSDTSEPVPFDLDGNPRILNVTVNMGAYEGTDCNGNGVEDVTDAEVGDCNGNALPDVCDVADGSSADINLNGIPDECEVRNLTQGTVHETIAEAILSATGGDDLLAAFQVFASELNIDLAGKPLVLRSTAQINQPAGGWIVLADDATLAAATGNDITVAGMLLVEVGDRVDIRADQFFVAAGGELSARPAAVVDLVANGGAQLSGIARVEPLALLSFSGALTTTGTLSLNAGTLSASAISNGGLLELFGGVIQTGTLANESPNGMLAGTGDIFADVINDGQATFIADTLVVGNYTNNGITTIQSGTLTITGSLIDNGVIIGNVSMKAGGMTEGPRSGGDGLTVLGDYVAGPGATLVMPSPAFALKVGGDVDPAIDDNDNYDMSMATLQMVGLAGTSQTFEVMSTDIGPSPAGLDRHQPGHFPIGTLRIGPTSTTIELADTHDNDGLGQASCEAVYVDTLIIEAGARLNTNLRKVYYATLTNAGTVDDPGNLVPIGIASGDINGDGVVDLVDRDLFVAVLIGLDNDPDHVTAADVNGDGWADGNDSQPFVALLLGL